MNELEKYTASIPNSNSNKAELIRQWKIDNDWGKEEKIELEDVTFGDVMPKPIQSLEQTKNKFNLGIDKAQDEVESLKTIDSVVRTETSAESTNMVSDLEN